MTKEEYSKKINTTATITRSIRSNKKIQFEIGELYDNQGKVESWDDGTSDQSFQVEAPGAFEYVLYCENVPCHKVDYEDKEECETLDAYDGEGEVLVRSDAKMRIVDVATDEDYQEMGYYQIEVKFEGFSLA